MSPTDKIILTDILERASKKISSRLGTTIVLKYVENPQSRSKKVETLFEEVCSVWGVSVETLRQPCRNTEFSMMRKILWLLARSNYPQVSLEKLAHMLNRRDHTTVIPAIKKAEFFLKKEDEIFLIYYNPIKHFFNAY